MSYNHGRAQKEFELEWAKTEAFFRENGMTEEQIAAMREYDLEVFKSERRYQEHTVKLSEAKTMMIASPEEPAVEINELHWLHVLPNELAEQLSGLKKEKLIAFYYHVVCGWSLREIASNFNKSRNTIREWIRRVYKVCERYKKTVHFGPSKRLYSEETNKSLTEYLEN